MEKGGGLLEGHEGGLQVLLGRVVLARLPCARTAGSSVKAMRSDLLIWVSLSLIAVIACFSVTTQRNSNIGTDTADLQIRRLAKRREPNVSLTSLNGPVLA